MLFRSDLVDGLTTFRQAKAGNSGLRRCDVPQAGCAHSRVPKLLALAGNFRKHVEESGFQSVQSQESSRPRCSRSHHPLLSTHPEARSHFAEKQVPRLGGRTSVIIGGKGRNVSVADAMSYVFGYSVINDVSERELNGDMSDARFGNLILSLTGYWANGSMEALHSVPRSLQLTKSAIHTL